MVGSADVPTTGKRHAYLWEAGVMTDLGTVPPTTQSEAWDINNLGQVVGLSSNTGDPAFAFLVVAGAGVWISRRDERPGPQRRPGIWHQRFGPSAGEYGGPPGETHVFLWENGQMIDLGTIGGLDCSRAWAINNRGQVVPRGSKDLVYRAFLYDPDEGMHDLQAFLPPENGWSELSSRNLNDASQIVGAGTFAGFRHAFLMTPIDANFDDDEDTDLINADALIGCLGGPGVLVEGDCKTRDIDRDGDVDMRDVQAMEWVFTGSPVPLRRLHRK